MNNEQVILKREAKSIILENGNIVKQFGLSFPKSNILNEALNHALVFESGLSVPTLIEIILEGEKRKIVMEYVKGETLESLIKKNSKSAMQYVSFMVDVQVEMHSKQVFGLKKLKDKLANKICEAPYDATTRYELFNLLEKLPTHDKLCHGDFNPSNIIIKEDGTYAIIDWSHATQGNASAEAANTYLNFVLNKKQKLADSYLDLFCDKSDTAVQYVKKWFPIIAANLAIKAKSAQREILDTYVKEVFTINQ